MKRHLPVAAVLVWVVPTLAGDDDQIAFIRNDHVFLSDTRGGHLRQLDDDPRKKGDLAWDPVTLRIYPTTPDMAVAAKQARSVQRRKDARKKEIENMVVRLGGRDVVFLESVQPAFGSLEREEKRPTSPAGQATKSDGLSYKDATEF